MKKCIILSAIVAGMLIGCGGSSNKQTKKINEPTAQSSTQSSTTQEKFKFSTTWLNGKKMYSVFEENGKLEIVGLNFTDKTLSMYMVQEPSKQDKADYIINEKGYIEYTETNSGEAMSVRATEKTDDYVTAVWTDKKNIDTKSEVEYIFFDINKAKQFVASKTK